MNNWENGGENLGSDGYVNFLEYNGGSMGGGVYVYVIMCQIILNICSLLCDW